MNLRKMILLYLFEFNTFLINIVKSWHSPCIMNSWHSP